MPPAEEDFGWFQEADFRLAVKTLAEREASSFVLVGGQSLIAWVFYYLIDIPHTPQPALTQDMDLIGPGDAAKRLADALHAKVFLPKPENHTPNNAVLEWSSPTTGQKLLIDVLSGIIGVPSNEVNALAVMLEIPTLPPIRVLHPIHCLQSRLANLHQLPEKRNGNGITQARVSVDIIRCFLTETYKRAGCRELGRAFTRICDISRSAAGLYCFQRYGIDPLAAFNSGNYDCPEWKERQWPQQIARIQAKRASDAVRIERYGTGDNHASSSQN